VSPCNPPLKFVANGPAGSAFPAPLDPSDVPTVDTNPGFTDLASSYLDALDPSADGSEQIANDAAAAVDTLETVGTAMDVTLDSILVLLDQAQPQKVDDALGTFAGAQPGAQGFVDDVNGLTVPAIGQVPMTLPNGGAAITFGAPPETGGVAQPGAAEYVLHLPVVSAAGSLRNVQAYNLIGPNPPFVTVAQDLVFEMVNGAPMWVALVTINPAAAGQFTATLYYQGDITITGISGRFQRQLLFQVVVA
jgi:hypothetical protein